MDFCSESGTKNPPGSSLTKWPGPYTVSRFAVPGLVNIQKTMENGDL